MRNQQGAALVIVMALLAGAMTLGLSGMQTALVDERLAGNYRAVTLAQMAAEWRASQVSIEDLGNAEETCEKLRSDSSWQYTPVELENGASSDFVTCLNSEEVEVLLVKGSVEQVSAVSFIEIGFSSSSNGAAVKVDDFIDWLTDDLVQAGAEENCDVNGIASGDISFCNSQFEDSSQRGNAGLIAGDQFNGATLISNEGFDFRLGDDVENLTLITPGEVSFNGGGGNNITGFIWSENGVEISGGGNRDFEFCAPEGVTVRGGSHESGEGCRSLETFLKENFGYEAGEGGDIASWTQF
ncbi:MAG: hypothetical protein LC677_04960 [Halomonas sp.]|nr:hypothetical protein [Halomonas sp.]